MSEPIRIFVVDDHPVVREGLVLMLSTQPDFEVVGDAEDGEAMLARVAEARPDIVLLDLEMPGGMDGVTALQHLRARFPRVRALVFTAFDTDERIVNAVQAGAQGYLLKGAPRAELFNAIRVIHAGGTLLQPVVASKLLRRLNAPSSGELTERELEVLRLLGRGRTNKEIAAALTITERTVKFHISSIFNKIGASNRTEALTLAVQRGLIALPNE